MKTIKWLFGLCLMALVVCGSGGSVQAYTSSHVTDDGIEYESYSDSDEITITDYKGTDETVIIPSEIDGNLVTWICGDFFDTRKIKHCTLPEGVTGIGKDIHWPLREFSNEPIVLESVSLPSTLKTIGDGVFAQCCNLSNITLPDGLTSIGSGVFYGCRYIEKLIIPDGVTQIGEDAFRLSSENNIPIYGNPYSYVKTYADSNKIKFSCLNHPNIVAVPAVAPNCIKGGHTEGTRCTVCGTYIIQPQEIEPNEQHLWDVQVLRKATVKRIGRKRLTCRICRKSRIEIIPKLALPQKGKTITEPASDNNYKVTKPATKNGTVELSKVDKTKSNVAVPDTITVDGVTYKVISISKDAFKGNKNLKKVTIGKNVTKINANAFNGCKNLKTVTVKSTQIKTVGKNAFNGINAKAKIKVPKSKLSYYKKLFAKKGLKSMVKIVK